MEPVTAFETMPQLLRATLVWQGTDAPAPVYQAAQKAVDDGYTIEAVVMGADADWVSLLAEPLGDFVWTFDFSWGARTFHAAAVCSPFESGPK